MSYACRRYAGAHPNLKRTRPVRRPILRKLSTLRRNPHTCRRGSGDNHAFERLGLATRAAISGTSSSRCRLFFPTKWSMSVASRMNRNQTGTWTLTGYRPDTVLYVERWFAALWAGLPQWSGSRRRVVVARSGTPGNPSAWGAFLSCLSATPATTADDGRRPRRPPLSEKGKKKASHPSLYGRHLAGSAESYSAVNGYSRIVAERTQYRVSALTIRVGFSPASSVRPHVTIFARSLFGHVTNIRKCAIPRSFLRSFHSF